MSALAAHFRKECRAHRTGVVGLALMVLLTGIILFLAPPDYWIEASLVSQLTLGAESETSVIAIVHPNKLVRIDVETGERERLFPFVTDQPTGESDK